MFQICLPLLLFFGLVGAQSYNFSDLTNITASSAGNGCMAAIDLAGDDGITVPSVFIGTAKAANASGCETFLKNTYGGQVGLAAGMPFVSNISDSGVLGDNPVFANMSLYNSSGLLVQDTSSLLIYGGSYDYNQTDSNYSETFINQVTMFQEDVGLDYQSFSYMPQGGTNDAPVQFNVSLNDMSVNVSAGQFSCGSFDQTEKGYLNTTNGNVVGTVRVMYFPFSSVSAKSGDNQTGVVVSYKDTADGKWIDQSNLTTVSQRFSHSINAAVYVQKMNVTYNYTVIAPQIYFWGNASLSNDSAINPSVIGNGTLMTYLVGSDGCPQCGKSMGDQVCVCIISVVSDTNGTNGDVMSSPGIFVTPGPPIISVDQVSGGVLPVPAPSPAPSPAPTPGPTPGPTPPGPTPSPPGPTPSGANVGVPMWATCATVVVIWARM